MTSSTDLLSNETGEDYIYKKKQQPFRVSGNGPKETQQMKFTQENLLKFGNNSKSGISTETYSVLLPLKSVRWKLCSRLV